MKGKLMHAAIFAIPALMLAVKGGYVISSLILLALSIITRVRTRFGISSFEIREKFDIRLPLAFWTFAALGISLSLYHQDGLKVVGNYIPFLLAPIAYIGVAHCRVAVWPIWFGAATAGFAAFFIAFYQLNVLGIDRALGFMHTPIFFGNSAIIVAAISLIGLIALPGTSRRPLSTAYLGLGAVAGVGASFFSGSKGGWISLPLLMLVVYHFAATTFSKKIARIGAIVVLSLVTVLAFSPNSPVLPRLQNFSTDLSRWLDSSSVSRENTGTASARLEMWKFAASVAGEHPILGFGRKALEERKMAAVTNGEADPIISHHPSVHNEIFEMYLENGVIGLSGLIFLFVSLFMIFYQKRSNPDLQIRAISLAGMVFLILYLEFGLTNVQFSLNAPRNIFCCWAVVLAATLHSMSTAANRKPDANMQENNNQYNHRI
ncbi:MAG: O-antigen ligase family protein [Burkholderiales bacterium]|nr:O-antigen ligase family protein [Burkholderiales bacterium]